ncbi:MAG TPA: M15 family metallopeptidase [Acidimicrobiia bacterium]|nr:M15 family metallopeptidase [Acidimicrobiia bacterium]
MSSTTSTVGPVITSTTAATVTTTTTTAPMSTTYVVWTSGGLTDGTVAALEDRFEVLSIVSGDAAPLDVGGGEVVPLDAIAIDIGSHSWFDTEGETSALRPGTVLLGESSAEFREAAAGDFLSFGGVEFEVVGVVSDELVGAAEVVFARADPGSPVATNRYALVSTTMNRAEFEFLVQSVNDAPVPVRIRAEGETPLLRHADGVLPQIHIKQALGEFSYPADTGAQLEQDEVWMSENLVIEELPILGTVTCHRVVMEMAEGALNQVVEEGLAALVRPEDFAGCWNARFVRTVTGEPSGVSRHSWGAALDINARSNLMGTEGDMDPRLVEIFEQWGFLWGGNWAVPDPMHFEYGIWPED